MSLRRVAGTFTGAITKKVEAELGTAPPFEDFGRIRKKKNLEQEVRYVNQKTAKSEQTKALTEAAMRRQESEMRTKLVNLLLKNKPSQAGAGSDTNRKHAQLFFNLISSMRKNSPHKLGTSLYDVASSALADYGRIELFDELQKWIASDSIRVTPAIVASRLRCLSGNRKYKDARDAFAAVNGTRMALSPIVLRSYLKAIMKDPKRRDDEIVDIVKKLVSQPGIAKCQQIYSIAITSVSSYDVAAAIIEIMNYEGVRVSPQIMNSIINLLSKSGDTRAAETLITAMQSKESTKPTTVTYCSLIQCYKVSSLPLSAGLDIRRRVEKRKLPRTSHYYSALLSLIYTRLDGLPKETQSTTDGVVADENSKQIITKTTVVELVDDILNEYISLHPRVSQTSHCWGKVAEIYGSLKEAKKLNSHLRKWMDDGPRLTKGSQAVILSAYRLLGDEGKINQMKLLIKERDNFYTNQVKRPLSCNTSLEVKETADGVDEMFTKGIVEEPSESPTKTAVIFGLKSFKTTEDELLSLLHRVGTPTALVLLHSNNDTFCRAYVMYSTSKEAQSLVLLNGTPLHGSNLTIIPSRSDSYFKFTRQLTQRLAIHPSTKAAVQAKLTTTRLSESLFKSQEQFKKIVSTSRIKRSIRR